MGLFLFICVIIKGEGSTFMFEKPVENPENIETNNQPIPLKPMVLIGIILVSLIAGMVGGVYGALSLAKNPGIQKLFSATSNGSLTQNLVLDENSAVIQVVETASPAVVSVVVSKQVATRSNSSFDPFGSFFGQNPSEVQSELRQIGAGSGFFVTSGGLILTNRHVVTDLDATYTVVTNDGKTLPATVVSRDPVNDLAIIKVEISDAKFLEFADSSNLELGQQVVAIGNSLGQYQNTVTSGIISGVGRSIVAGDRTGSEQLEGVIQTDAAINPGNSGGPLLNLAAQVVGINTAVDQQGQLVGFAISANDAKLALESYRKNGKITRPFLGIRYVMITEAIAETEKLPRKSGAYITTGLSGNPPVIEGGPADKAGLRAGDIIISINNQELSESNNLTKVMKSFSSGETVSVRILRDGNEQTVSVTLGEAQ